MRLKMSHGTALTYSSATTVEPSRMSSPLTLPSALSVWISATGALRRTSPPRASM